MAGRSSETQVTIEARTDATAVAFHDEGALKQDQAYGDTYISGQSRVQLGDVYNYNVLHGSATEQQKAAAEVDRRRRDEETTRDRFEMLHDLLSFAGRGARFRNIADPQPETCLWLRDHETFERWAGKKTSSENLRPFLWIKGKPGSGKSTLMKELCEWSTDLFPGALILPYFFNARSPDKLDKSSVGCYRSLVHQLLEVVVSEHTADIVDSTTYMPLNSPTGERARQLRNLFIRTFRALMHKRMELSRPEDLWTLTELSRFFKDCFCDFDLPPTVVLIDALDEGDEQEIRHLIQLLSRLAEATQQREVSLHICFASRHYPYITILNSVEIVLEHQQGHEDDIQTYINEELFAGPEKQMRHVRDLLRQKAAGVFLWVVLVVPMLNQASIRARLWQRLFRSSRKPRLK